MRLLCLERTPDIAENLFIQVELGACVTQQDSFLQQVGKYSSYTYLPSVEAVPLSYLPRPKFFTKQFSN